MLESLMSIPTLLSSIGLILAASSFISGLQLVRHQGRGRGIIHKFNGIASIAIYVVLAASPLKQTESGFGLFRMVRRLCLFFLKLL